MDDFFIVYVFKKMHVKKKYFAFFRLFLHRLKDVRFIKSACHDVTTGAENSPGLAWCKDQLDFFSLLFKILQKVQQSVNFCRRLQTKG